MRHIHVVNDIREFMNANGSELTDIQPVSLEFIASRILDDRLLQPTKLPQYDLFSVFTLKRIACRVADASDNRSVHHRKLLVPYRQSGSLFEL